MNVSFILIIIFVILVGGLYLPEVKSPTITNSTTEEIQHAVCKISSKDLEATANATVFRELKGVCTSVELETNLNHIKKNILEELEHIKNILYENGFKIPKVQPQLDELLKVPRPEATNDNDVESGEAKSTREIKSPKSRLEEISIYNNSAVDSNKGSIYFYYWNIGNIDTVLSKKKIYISSPLFNILGHSLHLQFYPNYLDEEYCGIQLKPSSRGFVKKHKIYVLNQIDKSLDIGSGLMFGFKEESMFRVPEDNIKQSGYINDRVLIVKVEIYLNS